MKKKKTHPFPAVPFCTTLLTSHGRLRSLLEPAAPVCPADPKLFVCLALISLPTGRVVFAVAVAPLTDDEAASERVGGALGCDSTLCSPLAC